MVYHIEQASGIHTPELSLPSGRILEVSNALREKGFEVLSGNEFALNQEMLVAQEAFQGSFEDMEQDPFISTDIVWRLRKFGRFGIFPQKSGGDVSESFSVNPIAYAPYKSKYLEPGLSPLNVQPRAFPEMNPAMYQNAFVRGCIEQLFRAIPTEKKGTASWEAKVHQVRVLSFADKLGEATPEGIHDDGHDFFAVVMMRRKNVQGAMSRVWSKDQQDSPIAQHTLLEPLDTLFVHDRAVLHDTTSLEPTGNIGHRDVMIISMDENSDLESSLIQ
ncbi:MAG: 2OG-Fe dioxygenase family protein [bacterium]|nr:2OG-Fe dioxygenase family protein [bacterium]